MPMHINCAWFLGGSAMKMEAKYWVFTARRNASQRATQNVKYGNIGSVDRQIKGKPL